MVFSKKWLRNHPKFLLHFLIQVNIDNNNNYYYHLIVYFLFYFKERKQRQEQERERRIAEGEVEETDTSRYQERQKLISLLGPLGLTIKDIQPDGNW